MLMSIILCVICFHASSAHPLWLLPPPCTCPCSLSFSAWCYQYEYSYSYSHNVCANNFVSYFNRHGNHSTTYLISSPPSLFRIFLPNCVSLQVSVVHLPHTLSPHPLWGSKGELASINIRARRRNNANGFGILV